MIIIDEFFLHYVTFRTVCADPFGMFLADKLFAVESSNISSFFQLGNFSGLEAYFLFSLQFDSYTRSLEIYCGRAERRRKTLSTSLNALRVYSNSICFSLFTFRAFPSVILYSFLPFLIVFIPASLVIYRIILPAFSTSLEAPDITQWIVCDGSFTK